MREKEKKKKRERTAPRVLAGKEGREGGSGQSLEKGGKGEGGGYSLLVPSGKKGRRDV